MKDKNENASIDDEQEVIGKEQGKRKHKGKLATFCKGILVGGIAAIIILKIVSPSQTVSSVPDNVVLQTDAENGTEVVTVPFLETISPAETVTEAELSQETTAAAIQETEPVTESVTKPVTEAQSAANSTWYTSTKEHDITVNSILTYENGAIWNFADCTAVGAGIKSDIAVPAEADYGFIVTVIDSNSVDITAYNNSTEYIIPVKVTAELFTGNLETTESYESYTITGYNACSNGFGTVNVTFSNGRTLVAGVFKENDRLYAVNINANKTIATNAVDRRLVLAKLMQDAGITEEDCVSTDPIYYPIVPVNKGEVTDTAYWVAKSSELVEADWTDAHKIMTFYNYVIDNFAYDDWIIAQGSKGRCFYNNDYSGESYTSSTNVGICEDFSQIIAIMCRAQGIPALVLDNHKHAVTVAYIEDYDRWFLIDSTADIENDAYQKDYTVWVKTNKVRYKSFGYTTATNFYKVSIGNYADMEQFGIPMFQ